MLNETQKQELKAMDASLLEHRYFQKARKAEDLDAIMAKLRRARSRLLKRKKDLISILKAHGITEETRFHEAERLLNQWLLAENFPTLEKITEYGHSESGDAIKKCVSPAPNEGIWDAVERSPYRNLYYSVSNYESWWLDRKDKERENAFHPKTDTLGEYWNWRIPTSFHEEVDHILKQADIADTDAQGAGEETRSFHVRNKRATTERPVDPYKAQAYAEQHAKNPSSLYKYYPDGDCTNFVSQCLFHGGMPMKKPKEIPNTDVYPSKTYWYSVGTGSRERVSGSWIRVNDFFPYMDDRFYGYVFDSYEGLIGRAHRGDIIVCGEKKVWGPSWSHVVLCTVNNGKLCYCGHSNNRLHEPIKTLTSGFDTWCVFDTSRWQSM